MATSTAVVLAAGRGTRLAPLTDSLPKCLIPVAGKPLIDHVLEALVKAGIREAVVVTGHRGHQLREALNHRTGLMLEFVHNGAFDQGNASSLRCALECVSAQPFLLVMGDHLVSSDLLIEFLDATGAGCALAVDRTELDGERWDEATKVQVARRRVIRLGKKVAGEAIDTGVSHWAAGAFDSQSENGIDGELAALMMRVARRRRVDAVDVSGHFWFDIDTSEDIREAEATFLRNAELVG